MKGLGKQIILQLVEEKVCGKNKIRRKDLCMIIRIQNKIKLKRREKMKIM
jgi:hypothetical protein